MRKKGLILESTVFGLILATGVAGERGIKNFFNGPIIHNTSESVENFGTRKSRKEIKGDVGHKNYKIEDKNLDISENVPENGESSVRDNIKSTDNINSLSESLLHDTTHKSNYSDNGMSNRSAKSSTTNLIVNPKKEFSLDNQLLGMLLCTPEDKNYFVMENQISSLYGSTYDLPEKELLRMVQESGNIVTVCSDGELLSYVPRDYNKETGIWDSVDIRIRQGNENYWNLDEYCGRDLAVREEILRRRDYLQRDKDLERENGVKKNKQKNSQFYRGKRP